MRDGVAELEDLLAEAREGGGEKYARRHVERGKLLPRERIEVLLDPDAPFLELQPLIGWGTEFQVGGSVITGIGVVSGVECVLIAHDPTVHGGATNPYSLRRVLRSLAIAERNRLPVINLVESAGADLPTQAELFVPGGEIFRRLTNLSADRIPTVAVVFGNSTAGGAYVPGMSDYTIAVRDKAKIFLGGPPLVKMATGEVSDDQSLGGAEMHSRTSGLVDYLAADEYEALEMARSIVTNLHWSKAGRTPLAVVEPLYDPEDLLDLAPEDPRMSMDPTDLLIRISDGSKLSEFKPLYGTALWTGWAVVHGFPVGILANSRGVLFSEEARKAAQFIQLANQTDTPLVFIHNTTGFMVGRDYECGGIIKDGAKMINAVANSQVPHIGLIAGASYGAANYAMSGRAYDPNFLFAWPGSRLAVMGGEQLAGVLSIVSRDAAERTGTEFDETADAEMKAKVTGQIESESTAFANTGRGYDDGIIDPRDTRTVLGIALSACHSRRIQGARGYGVYRM